ncbi:hypothetical protein SAMN04489867_3316 [Pedococcus dokdonensis]|uniref:Uncharacterized protein n=1 Tax=Pedococcus dokdonensis TaxID=443156 RepID=A0A1H0UGT9_9MICO|nr:hypothetical protein [Pedococcus dokdonensis]SDP65361.1 hypothetical protein SAMN04489867_3316 [Pedococcus dokdonensis]
MASRSPLRPCALVVATALALPLAACGGPDRLEGTVVAVDDTGQKDRPLGGGWVAVLEDDSLTDFLGQSGIDVPGSADLPYAAGRVLHDDVTSAGGVLAPIDDKGRFTLTATGRRTLCRLVEAPQVDLLKGCATITVPATGRLELGTGEGGLTATLDD